MACKAALISAAGLLACRLAAAAPPGTCFQDPLGAQAAACFPSPDTTTLSWLSSRLSWLDVNALRAVPPGAADEFLARAAAAKSDDLDLLTDPSLSGGPMMLYFSQDVMAGLSQKYTAGILPVSGTTKDGRPFHMRAMVAGAGRLAFLYDVEQDFKAEDAGDEVKITNSGVVEARIQGPGDISFEAGYHGCGCRRVVLINFCGCAEIQRMTKTAAGQMTVKTDHGSDTAKLEPIKAGKR